jgi:hypothetical protein
MERLKQPSFAASSRGDCRLHTLTVNKINSTRVEGLSFDNRRGNQGQVVGVMNQSRQSSDAMTASSQLCCSSSRHPQPRAPRASPCYSHDTQDLTPSAVKLSSSTGHLTQSQLDEMLLVTGKGKTRPDIKTLDLLIKDACHLCNRLR